MKATEQNIATLVMEVTSCMSCPLVRYNSKESFWYCSHWCSPENHLIKKSTKGIEDLKRIEEYYPKWCPLPRTKYLSKDKRIALGI